MNSLFQHVLFFLQQFFVLQLVVQNELLLMRIDVVLLLIVFGIVDA
jgi:hypothetical protein